MSARKVGPEHCTPEQLVAAMRLFDRIYEIKQRLRERREAACRKS